MIAMFSGCKAYIKEAKEVSWGVDKLLKESDLLRIKTSITEESKNLARIFPAATATAQKDERPTAQTTMIRTSCNLGC